MSFGNSPFGNHPFGLTEPSSSPGTSKTWNGTRAIDPSTKRLVISMDDGRPESMNPSQQQVYTALATLKNSSAVKGVGSEFARVQLVTAGMEYKMQNLTQSALQRMIDNNQIALDSVTTYSDPNSSRVAVDIRWIDLLDNTTYTFNWNING